MLSINPDVVCAIIEKCQEFHAKEEVSIPHENEWDGGDDWAMQMLVDHADDSTLAELKYIIQDLDPGHQVELVALIWLGRGDYSTGEWKEAICEAHSHWNSRTADYVVAMPLVADYLQEGLWNLGYGCGEE